MNKPEFEAWSHPNLANFASEAFDEMVKLQDEAEQLRKDIKGVLKLYRKLIVESERARKTD